jgi:hypothetical protein
MPNASVPMPSRPRRRAISKPDSLDNFIACLAHITSGAPKLPFYYYNIPILSGVRFDMVDFLRKGGARIPNLRGIKFSDSHLHELLACVEFDGRRYDILFGVDEMLLGGLAFGARGAVGSTFNFAAPLYLKIIAAFDRGDLAEARRLQSLSAAMVRVIVGIGGRGGPQGRDGPRGRGVRLQPPADRDLHAGTARPDEKRAGRPRLLRLGPPVMAWSDEKNRAAAAADWPRPGHECG